MSESNPTHTWKGKEASLLKISSPEDDSIYAHCKRPTLEILNEYQKLAAQEPYKALQMVFEKCAEGDLDHDEEFVLAAGKALVQQMILDKETAINNEVGQDEIKKSAAMVRHYFKVDPYQLPTNEFYKLLSEALWLQEHQQKQWEFVITKSLVTIFSNQQ